MPGLPSLTAQAVEILVERVETQFDEGVDNVSRAITNITVPQTIGEDRYNENKTKFGFEQMVKLYLYRRVRGLSQRQMIQRLNRQVYLKQRFGFDDRVPRQQTLSNTENADKEYGRFTPDTKQALDIAARAIAQEADERNAIIQELAPTLLQPEGTENDEQKSKREYKRVKSQKSVRLARKHAIQHFATNRATNKTYTDEEIFDVLARMCATTGSSHSEGEYGWLTDDDYTPDGSTIIRCIKKSSTPDDEPQQLTLNDYLTDDNELPEIAAIRDAAVSAFDKGTRNIISSINGDTPFADRETIASIDITYERIYISPWKDRDEAIPNEDFPKMASGYKKSDDPDDDKKGEIRYGYKYATISLVGNNVPIILGVEPVKENSGWEPDGAPSYALADIVDRLLAKAQQFVDLDIVLFDREFYSHGVFNTVDKRDITYITPKKVYTDDYRNIENIQEHPTADAAIEHDTTSSDGERSHKQDVLYVPSREEDGKYAVFATNQRVETGEMFHVIGKYRYRWDSEIEFKSIKDFMPRTSSMDYRVRFTSFVFATLIYNLWRLTDYLIKRAFDKPIRDEPVIGGRTFARAVGNFLREIG